MYPLIPHEIVAAAVEVALALLVAVAAWWHCVLSTRT